MFILFADGGSRGNPGDSACGFVIWETSQSPTNSLQILDLKTKGELQKVFENGVYLGKITNNQAEWQGLSLGVAKVLEIFEKKSEEDKPELAVCLDSELVIRQIQGRYKVKNEGLKGFYQQVKNLEKDFQKISYYHIYREYNGEADLLVNQVLDELKRS